MTRERRRLLATSLVAVVTVTGAVVVVAHSGDASQHEDADPAYVGTEFPTDIAEAEPSVDTEPEPTASAGAPEVAWTVDAAELYGRSFAEFRDPRYGTEFDSGEPGVVDAGGILVTAMGLPDPRGYSLDEAVFVGLDAADGAERWRSPVGTLGGCAAELVDRNLVCYRGIGDNGLVVVNVDSGSSTAVPLPADWTVFALAADAGRVLVVEGNPEDDDVEVHAGPPTAPGSAWTARFDTGDAWESIDGSGVIRASRGLAVLNMGGDVIALDAGTGRQLWSRGLPDCVGDPVITAPDLVVITRSDCGDGRVRGADVVDPSGRVLADTDTGWVLGSLLDDAETGSPLLLGDAAYGRRTGEQLWRSPELVSGTRTVVTDNVVLVRDREVVGLDAESGEVRWRNTVESDVQTVLLGDADLVLAGSRIVTAIDLDTGDVAWTLPLRSLGDLNGAVVATVGDDVVVMTGREMAVLSR